MREQIEAATVAIISRKKDQQDLETFIRTADANRDAAIKEFNEERQAYMMDLTGCLDKLQALRLEKSSIEERLEYVKYEMKRRILQEQAMETSSVCSAAGTERRIVDRAVDDRPQRKDPAGDVPRPRAAGPGEVTVSSGNILTFSHAQLFCTPHAIVHSFWVMFISNILFLMILLL